MTLKRHLITATSLAVASGALALGALAAPAQAASANISEWTTEFTSCNTAYQFCLFYSPGGTGGVLGVKAEKVPNLSGYTFSGGAGNGKAVRNDAASADNGSDCNVGIWVSTNYGGNSDWLSPFKGGNLGPDLRNNEASIAIDDSTNCSGVGIG
jgi:Peptidase inhibitor family I36